MSRSRSRHAADASRPGATGGQAASGAACEWSDNNPSRSSDTGSSASATSRHQNFSSAFVSSAQSPSSSTSDRPSSQGHRGEGRSTTPSWRGGGPQSSAPPSQAFPQAGQSQPPPMLSTPTAYGTPSHYATHHSLSTQPHMPMLSYEQSYHQHFHSPYPPSAPYSHADARHPMAYHSAPPMRSPVQASDLAPAASGLDYVGQQTIRQPQPIVTRNEQGTTYYTFGPFPPPPEYYAPPTTQSQPALPQVQMHAQRPGIGPQQALPPVETPQTYGQGHHPIGTTPSPYGDPSRQPSWGHTDPSASRSTAFQPTDASYLGDRGTRGRAASGSYAPPWQFARRNDGLSSASTSRPGETRPGKGGSKATPVDGPSRQHRPSASNKETDLQAGHGVPEQTTRSEYVMWVGNVPSNATQSELHAFFARLPPPDAQDTTQQREPLGGVLSIFIITRSNCAFVNYVSADALQRAVDYFNGTTLRPDDTRTTKLVCRVRDQTEAQSGAAGQKGKGIHVAWLKDYNRRRRSEEAATSATSDDRSQASTADLSKEDGPLSDSGVSSVGGAGEAGSTSASSADISFASTNSELLRHPAFSKRFFILKSRSSEELDHAVTTCLWSTQPRNEGVLDQAYRNSEDVILIFSANQSGVFYGYARMTGPISSASQHEDDGYEEDSTSPGAGSHRPPDAVTIFSPRTVNASPDSLIDEEEDEQALGSQTREQSPRSVAAEGADAIMSEEGQPAASVPIRRATSERQRRQQSTTDQLVDDGVVRRDMAFPNVTLPAFASSAMESSTTLRPGDSASCDRTASDSDPSMRAMVNNLRLNESKSEGREEAEAEKPAQRQTSAAAPATSSSEDHGSPFSIQWLQKVPLPFSNVKHLRNAWNQDRSIRVARDGTEVAIDTGLELLSAWEEYAAQKLQQQ